MVDINNNLSMVGLLMGGLLMSYYYSWLILILKIPSPMKWNNTILWSQLCGNSLLRHVLFFGVFNTRGMGLFYDMNIDQL